VNVGVRNTTPHPPFGEDQQIRGRGIKGEGKRPRKILIKTKFVLIAIVSEPKASGR
jgi:hypothetical protein